MPVIFYCKKIGDLISGKQAQDSHKTSVFTRVKSEGCPLTFSTHNRMSRKHITGIFCDLFVFKQINTAIVHNNDK